MLESNSPISINVRKIKYECGLMRFYAIYETDAVKKLQHFDKILGPITINKKTDYYFFLQNRTMQLILSNKIH